MYTGLEGSRLNHRHALGGTVHHLAMLLQHFLLPHRTTHTDEALALDPSRHDRERFLHDAETINHLENLKDSDEFNVWTGSPATVSRRSV